MIAKLRSTYHEYPGQFWLLTAATLIDLMGGFLIFPFFSLFFTQKFDVGLAQVGLIYAIWAITGMIGQTLGGALADRAGRKNLVIFGLIFSALGSLGLALVEDFALVYIVAAVGGLFAHIGGPAREAMVADILPKEQYSDGYGILRVVANLAFAFGPAIGGLLAGVSYVLLFFVDAATSVLAAIFVARFLKETQPAASAEKTSKQSIGSVFKGFITVLKDLKLIAIIFLGSVVGMAYFQWYFALPVFMRDVHGMPPQFYGSMMSMAGVLVVLFQLPITRKLRGYSPMLLMGAASLLFLLGLSMFGFIAAYVLFLLASAIITFGEMIFFPTQQAIVANLAPEDMRGRYMAVAGLGFALPNILGPTLGGLLLDNGDPNNLWYIAGLVCLVGAVGYMALKPFFTGKTVSKEPTTDTLISRKQNEGDNV